MYKKSTAKVFVHHEAKRWEVYTNLSGKFLYTTKAHCIMILSYTTQKANVLIFEWRNVNKET